MQPRDFRARVQELLHYDPETGVFTWLVVKGRRGLPGKTAGTIGADGYVIITIDGRKLRAHRLAWLCVHGTEPPNEIDHCNLIRHDNRLCNLRLATSRQNKENKDKLRNNKSGYRGVSWHARAGRWQSTIRSNGKTTYLGLFDSAPEAHEAYRLAAGRLHDRNPFARSA